MPTLTNSFFRGPGARRSTMLRLPSVRLSNQALRHLNPYSTIPNTKNSPQGPNKPASETSGTADGNKGESPKSDSSLGGDDGADSRHPAKQPDGQKEPTRSTGIGNQGSVSTKEKAGGKGPE